MKHQSKIAITFVVLSVVFQVWAFTNVPEARIYVEGPRVPDLRAGGYGVEETRSLLREMGDQRRATYLIAQKKVDLAIPALGAGMFFFGIWALANRPKPGGQRSAVGALGLAMTGLIGPLFDYGENALVASMMRAGPDALDATTVEWASWCTRLEFLFLGVSLLMMIVLALRNWRMRRT